MCYCRQTSTNRAVMRVADLNRGTADWNPPTYFDLPFRPVETIMSPPGMAPPHHQRNLDSDFGAGWGDEGPRENAGAARDSQPRPEMISLPPIRQAFPQIDLPIGDPRSQERTGSLETSPVMGGRAVTPPEYVHDSDAHGKRRRDSTDDDEARQEGRASRVPRLYESPTSLSRQLPRLQITSNGPSPTLPPSFSSTTNDTWSARRSPLPTESRSVYPDPRDSRGRERFESESYHSGSDLRSPPLWGAETRRAAPHAGQPPTHREYEQLTGSPDPNPRRPTMHPEISPRTAANETRHDLPGLLGRPNPQYDSRFGPENPIHVERPPMYRAMSDDYASECSRDRASPGHPSSSTEFSFRAPQYHTHDRSQSLTPGPTASFERTPFSSAVPPPYPTHAYPGHLPPPHSGAPEYMSMADPAMRYYGMSQAPHMGGMASEPRPRRRRGNLPKEVTDKLRTWFGEHLDHPYPTEDQKQRLMQMTGLNMNQISNWFINARRRNLPQMLNDRNNRAAATRTQRPSSTGPPPMPQSAGQMSLPPLPPTRTLAGHGDNDDISSTDSGNTVIDPSLRHVQQHHYSSAPTS